MSANKEGGRSLRIGKDFTLPLDAVTQTMAAIGRKGAGKTYLATMIAEQMLNAGAQAVALDPVGNWWGLRVASDGKSPGKDIYVMGGEQGDIPLVPEAGARVARLIVEKSIAAVIDVSRFRIGERKRFAADFGEELLQLKKSQRSAMHLFIEEAQLFVPQRIGPDETRMFSAFEQLVRLGRNYGVGSTLVSQRPQSVNKEVLSQVECLCVLQVTGPHERKALEEWVQEAGADRKLVGQLPGLNRGEGFVWSPQWLRKFERVKFAQKVTFDASATPEVGKAARAAKLTAVDVEALKADLAEVVEKAQADDPKALRRRIAELESAANKAAPAKADTDELRRLRTLVHEWQEQWDRLLADLRKVGVSVVQDGGRSHVENAPMKALAELVSRFGDAAFWVATDARRPVTRVHAPKADATPVQRQPARTPRRALGPADNSLAKGEKQVLCAIAQHSNGVTREQLTVLTGYKRSSRDTYIQRLNSKGYIGHLNGRITASDEGVRALGDDYEPLPTGRDLQAYWLNNLPEGERAVLLGLITSYPNAVDRETISEYTGYKRSSRDTYIQRLRSRQLVEVVGGQVRAVEALF